MIKIYPTNQDSRDKIEVEWSYRLLNTLSFKIREIMEDDNIPVIKANISNLLFTCWRKASKNNQLKHIKFMLEADYIHVTDENINTLAFRAGANDCLPMFKYLLENVEMNDTRWGNALYGSFDSKGYDVINFVLSNHQYTSKTISDFLLHTKQNIPAFELLLAHINTKDIEPDALHKMVHEQCFDFIKILIEKHQVDFTPFKELAIKHQKEVNGDKILNMIETQELYLNMHSSMAKKPSLIKTKKI